MQNVQQFIGSAIFTKIKQFY